MRVNRIEYFYDSTVIGQSMKSCEAASTEARPMSRRPLVPSLQLLCRTTLSGVRTSTRFAVTPGVDEFLLLACDGVWEIMNTSEGGLLFILRRGSVQVTLGRSMNLSAFVVVMIRIREPGYSGRSRATTLAS